MLFTLLLLTLPGIAGADVAPQQVPNKQSAAFTPLFDGKTLKGWRGDTRYWRVHEGTIVGDTGPEGISANTFLIAEGNYADFVLRVKFRHRNHASGIQFRSRPFGNPKLFRVSGYQADIGGGDTGTFYEEQGRGTLAPAHREFVKKVYRPHEWNAYEIRAEGSRVEIYLNGKVTARYEEKKRGVPRDGLVALQLQAGPAMTIAFKDLQIRKLPPAKVGAPEP